MFTNGHKIISGRNMICNNSEEEKKNEKEIDMHPDIYMEPKKDNYQTSL